MDEEKLQEIKDKYLNKRIKIIRMIGEKKYSNRVGIVTNVDDYGQLHGSWGGLAVIPGPDDIEVLEYGEL